MQWNKAKRAALTARNAAMVWDAPDPAYTLTLKHVVALTGIYAAKIYTMQAAGKFPLPKRFASTDTKYHPDEITAFLRDRNAGREWMQ